MSNDRKSPVTHKDLALAYMTKGIEAVDRAIVGHTDPIGVLDKVIGNLSDLDPDRDLSDLQDRREMFADRLTPGVKGRKPARIGDTRAYLAQEVNGDVFMRLPLSTMGVEKGQKLNVSFRDGSIVVTVA